MHHSNQDERSGLFYGQLWRPLIRTHFCTSQSNFLLSMKTFYSKDMFIVHILLSAYRNISLIFAGERYISEIVHYLSRQYLTSLEHILSSMYPRYWQSYVIPNIKFIKIKQLFKYLSKQSELMGDFQRPCVCSLRHITRMVRYYLLECQIEEKPTQFFGLDAATGHV